MNYAEALAWLYGAQMRGIKLGLDNTRRLLAAIGFTGAGQKFIHVAGTNGKGSVCAMVYSICRAAGYRTGLFTSPHLISFRERICIDGAQISEADVAAALSRLREAVEGWETHPTFFELTTALALRYYEEQRCEVVVLETGLGGRFDSTNVVTPAVSVITAIDIDHQSWLGDSLGQIAFQKAGIIKPGVPVVSAPQFPEVGAVLAEVAVTQHSPLWTVTEPAALHPVALEGSHQQLNAAIAVKALEAAGFAFPHEVVATGLANVAWPGRFQRVQDRIVLDGAHNPAAAARLATTWREIFGEAKATVVFGALRDKDVGGICRALAPIAGKFIVTPVQSTRACSVEELSRHAAAAMPGSSVQQAPDVAEALRLAESEPGKILVTGSLFLVGAALAHLTGNRGAESSAQ